MMMFNKKQLNNKSTEELKYIYFNLCKFFKFDVSKISIDINNRNDLLYVIHTILDNLEERIMKKNGKCV